MTIDIINAIIDGGVLVFIVLVSTVGISADALDWNHGVCKKNGLPWKSFDMDSQGGRGYNAGDETIWISWPVDHNFTKKVCDFLED